MKRLQAKDKEEPDSQGSIWQIYHSQKIWFTQEKNNGHTDSAVAHLKESAALLEDCATKIDALEETLANTPKPSEMLNWNTLTLSDLIQDSD